jgi:hypothetical protein
MEEVGAVLNQGLALAGLPDVEWTTDNMLALALIAAVLLSKAARAVKKPSAEQGF